MRRFCSVVLLVVCLATGDSTGQNPGSNAGLIGTVIDSETRLPLAGVKILMAARGLAITTEPDGRLLIPHLIPSGARLEFSHADYHTIVLTELEIPYGYTSYLELAMTPRRKDSPVTVRFDGAFNRTLPAVLMVSQDSIVLDSTAVLDAGSDEQLEPEEDDSAATDTLADEWSETMATDTEYESDYETGASIDCSIVVEEFGTSVSAEDKPFIEDEMTEELRMFLRFLVNWCSPERSEGLCRQLELKVKTLFYPYFVEWSEIP